MLEKLEKCRICIESVFRIYLSNREQLVQIDNVNINIQIVSSSISQGTVLRPVIFKPYINILLYLDTFAKISSLPDDTAFCTLHYHGGTWNKK